MKKKLAEPKTVTYIDPTSGWMYGFPKPIPSGWYDMTADEVHAALEQRANELFGVGGGSYNIGYGDG